MGNKRRDNKIRWLKNFENYFYLSFFSFEIITLLIEYWHWAKYWWILKKSWICSIGKIHIFRSKENERFL